MQCKSKPKLEGEFQNYRNDAKGQIKEQAGKEVLALSTRALRTRSRTAQKFYKGAMEHSEKSKS